jgi:AcrR family transcriptional regulator
VPNRRERVRAATVDEIRQTARKLLVAEGISGVSVRAIAREMGMTAAALYRYFPNLESLLFSLCSDLYDECRGYIERERDHAGHRPGDQLYAIARAFRSWSVAHPTEFNLMFSSPVPGMKDPMKADGINGAGFRFAMAFGVVFGRLWKENPFPFPADAMIPADLAPQLESFVEKAGLGLPLGVAQLFLSCWIRIYGIVALEIYGHLHFALSDVLPMFEAELADVARMLGVAA